MKHNCEVIGDLISHAVEYGAARQRLEDAQADLNYEAEKLQEQVDALTALHPCNAIPEGLN